MLSSAARARQLIRGSYVEGALYACMVGMAEAFALFFAVQQGVSLSQLALLSTLPPLMGSLFQWVMPQLVGNGGIRRAKLVFYIVQIIGLFCLCRAAVSENLFPWLFSALSLYWIGGMTSGPFWLQWAVNQIPSQAFGSFLSKRNAFVAFCTLAAYISAAAFLNLRSSPEDFLIVFAFGTLSRILSFLSQASISKIQIEWSRYRPEVTGDRQTLARSPVMWMIALTVLFKIAVTTSTPFFLPYMVQELKFGVLEYVALTSIPFVGRFVFLSGWGRASNDFRPFIGLQIACIGIALIPAMWAYTNNFYFYMFLELFSGVLWGGFELCSVLIVQRFRPSSTLRTLGLHMSLMSAASVLGALLGSRWMQSSGYTYQDLFLLSSSLRLFVAATMVIVFLRLPMTRVRLKVYGEYLSTVLSLRPSFANVGRLLMAPRRTRNPHQSKKNRF
jgi:hypothetical protein